MMIVTQFPDPFRRRCSNLVLRRAPRLHDMKSASAWPAKLAMLVTQRRESPVCQDRPQGRSAWKKQLPRESCLFRGLDWRGVSMLHRAAIPLVTHSAARCLAPGDLLVLHLKIDIFCHLSIFFLTSAGSAALSFWRIAAPFPDVPRYMGRSDGKRNAPTTGRRGRRPLQMTVFRQSKGAPRRVRLVCFP